MEWLLFDEELLFVFTWRFWTLFIFTRNAILFCVTDLSSSVILPPELFSVARGCLQAAVLLVVFDTFLPLRQSFVDSDTSNSLWEISREIILTNISFAVTMGD